jgi:FkbM family methyltransferase
MDLLRAVGRRLLPHRAKSFIRRAVFSDHFQADEDRSEDGEDHSQAGEGACLNNIVRNYECLEWIIDIGANDGVRVSNSLQFVKRGWRAILIEPAPAVFQKLLANHVTRENVTCLQIACSDRTGEAKLYFGSDGEEGLLSTLCTSNNEWFSTARSSQWIDVRTDTITNILRYHNSPVHPGILLVDCEGMDYEVLLGLDFDQFRPTVIVTEEYEWEPGKHSAKYALLIKANYSLFQKIGCNTIWIDRAAVRRHQTFCKAYSRPHAHGPSSELTLRPARNCGGE